MAKSDSNIPGSPSFSSFRREFDYVKENIKEDIVEIKKLKADRSYVVPEFESIKREVDKMGVLIQELQKKKHYCFKIEVIETMQKSIDTIKNVIDSWKSIKIGAVVIIITMISAVIANYFSLKNSVDNSVVVSNQVKEDVLLKLNSFEEELKNKEISDTDRARNKEDMKEALREVVVELDSNNDNEEKNKNKR